MSLSEESCIMCNRTASKPYGYASHASVAGPSGCNSRLEGLMMIVYDIALLNTICW